MLNARARTRANYQCQQMLTLVKDITVRTDHVSPTITVMICGLTHSNTLIMILYTINVTESKVSKQLASTLIDCNELIDNRLHIQAINIVMMGIAYSQIIESFLCHCAPEPGLQTPQTAE